MSNTETTEQIPALPNDFNQMGEYYLSPEEMAFVLKLNAQMEAVVALICSQQHLQGSWNFQGNKIVRQG